MANLVENCITQAGHMATGSKKSQNQDAAPACGYVDIVRNDSPQAAAALERLLDAAGTAALLRATYILSLLKMEVVQNCFMPDLKSYRYMIQEFDDAHTALFEQAIEGCLRAWGVKDIVVSFRNGNAAYPIKPPGV